LSWHLEFICHSLGEIKVVIGNGVGFLLGQRRLLRAEAIQLLSSFFIVPSLDVCNACMTTWLEWGRHLNHATALGIYDWVGA
jgi:hypothetical protein